MNILLLEPDYKNKYPPIGLMKLSYYHKEIRKDFVWFQKGKLPAAVSKDVEEKIKASKYYNDNYDVESFINHANATISELAWDRIYITTLFTFEWKRTVEIIEYAKTLAAKEKIFVGGILASLMADELEEVTGIKPTTGLLTCSSMLGYDDKVNIDALIPDYSLLENIEYTYPDNDAYFASCTKGCGMKCSFCAVQTLEPEYQPYIPIAEQIKKINEKYGERHNLLLMDNNVLKSPCFEKIIDDIIDAGFGKGATWINPKTGKPNLRYVDFNQGLDANLLTKEKAKLLAKTALRPVRIAFDHVDDKDKYIKAITIVEESGLNHISNYMLYNTAAFKGKGTQKKGDMPEDLYIRLKINIDFAHEHCELRQKQGKPALNCYSFPMQYIPLGAKDRTFLGANWTPKTYQAVKRIIYMSKGTVYPRKILFESMWGKDVEDFKTRLLLPKLYIERCLAASAALTSEGTRHKNVEQNKAWLDVWEEWSRLYKGLSDNDMLDFTELISDNKYSLERYIGINDFKIRLLYIHYFTSTSLVDFLYELSYREPDLFMEASYYLNNNGKIVIAVNIFYLFRLKLGKEHINKLNKILNKSSIELLIS